MVRHTLNTVLIGITDAEETRSSRKRYVRSVMHVSKKLPPEKEERYIVDGFSRQDSERVLARENNLMVIKVQVQD